MEISVIARLSDEGVKVAITLSKNETVLSSCKAFPEFFSVTRLKVFGKTYTLKLIKKIMVSNWYQSGLFFYIGA